MRILYGPVTMFDKKIQTATSAVSRLTTYCDQIIIASLLVIIIAVPLYFDIHLHSVFDLSKITVLFVLTFAIMAIWSIKAIITCRKDSCADLPHAQDNPVQQPEGIDHTRAGFYKTQPLRLPIITILLAGGLSMLFSINPYLSLTGTYKRYGGFISTIVYVLLFLVIVCFVERRRLDSFLKAIILTACIASVYGILQHFGLDVYQWSTDFGYGIRVSSTFGHPAFFSAFLIMVIPLVLIKIFSGSDLRYSTFLYIGILALLTVAFYYTKTRASFIGLIISNLFFFSMIGKDNLLANMSKTSVTLAVLIGISVFFNLDNKTSILERFTEDIRTTHTGSGQEEDTNNMKGKRAAGQDLYHPRLPTAGRDGQEHLPVDTSDWHVGLAHQLEGTTLTRFLQYLAGLRIIYDYPVLGIGEDTLGMIYPRYISRLYREMNEHRSFENQNRIHNDLLNITVSTGLTGLGAYLWFIFAYAGMVWKGCNKTKGPGRVLLIGLCAGCLAYFVQNQFSFGHIPIITLFWFLVAMSVIACPTRTGPTGWPGRRITYPPAGCQPARQGRAGRSARYTSCGLITCLMILLIILTLFRYKADIYFEHGRRSLDKDAIAEALQSYEMAVKYNPLELNYNNVLNGVYLKMAAIGTSRDSEDIRKDLPDLFSRKQTTIWFANAVDGAEKVQEMYPMDYHSAFTLGEAYHLLDRVTGEDRSQEVIRYYKRAVSLHPYKFKYRNKLAQFYAEKGLYEDAIRELKEGKNISPDNQAPYLNLAKVFMDDRERYEDAETVLLEFITRNPDHKAIDVYRVLSYVYLKTGRWEDVLSQSEEIIKTDREDLEAHKYAIMASFKLERYEDARNLCNRILDSAGSQDNTYSKYAKEMLEAISRLQVK